MPHAGFRAALVLGGIRSGKSEYAESLVGPATEVRYVATATSTGDDPEWAARLAAHRARRPATWLTEETGADPRRLVELLGEAKPDQTVLVDDLGGWITALLAAGGPVQEAVADLVEAVRQTAARLVVVSPEVGLSLVPATELGRAFADAVGSANRALADACDAVVLVVAGQPTWLKRGVPVARVVPVKGAAVIAPPAPADDDDLAIEPGMTLPVPDQEAVVRVTERLVGAGLGALGEVVAFAAGAQGTAGPRPFQAVRVLVLHGAHEGGLAAGDDAPERARRRRELAEGGGPVGVLAAEAGAGVQLVDVGTAGLPAAAPVEDRDACGTGDVDAALRYGWRLADQAVDGGTELLVLAADGPGQEAAAVAVIAATTSAEAFALLPRVRRAGGRFDDDAWMVRCAAVRDALHRARGRARRPKDLLAALGGTDLAVAVGVLLGASARRTPVVVDGPVGVAAGLVARDLASQSRLWLLLADHGGHPATETGADTLSLTPVAALGLGLGEGAAGLAVLPLIRSALLLSSVDAPEPISA